MRYTLQLALLMILTAIMTVSISCNTSRKTLVMEEGWELLGETKVNFIKDKDEILVDSTKKYTQIRFKVEDREIKLEEVKVYFSNGDKLEPNLAEPIKPAEFSRDVDLSYEGKAIHKIQFKYRTTGNILKGRAAILVFGKKYMGW
jgi:hypothetical protein